MTDRSPGGSTVGSRGPIASLLILGVWLALSGALLTGCAGGFTGPTPTVTDPLRASNVTFYRTKGLVGVVGPIEVRLEGQPLMRLWAGQSFSFRLDPGEYIIDYSIGFNDCRRAILIFPGYSYSFRLVPNCSLLESWK